MVSWYWWFMILFKKLVLLLKVRPIIKARLHYNKLPALSQRNNTFINQIVVLQCFLPLRTAGGGWPSTFNPLRHHFCHGVHEKKWINLFIQLTKW